MWYVIMKLVAKWKDVNYLIKMVNFKGVIFFIKILTCFSLNRTFGNAIYINIYIYIYSIVNIYIYIYIYIYICITANINVLQEIKLCVIKC